jgi:hypothetical protein
MFAQVGDILRYFLYDTGSDTAQNVIKKEFLRSPDIFHHAAEHIQGKHIEENMSETAMRKHIGNQLIEVEVLSHEEVQAEIVVQQVFPVGIGSEQHGGQKDKRIDNEQVFGYWWDITYHYSLIYGSLIAAKLRKNSVIQQFSVG